MHFLETNATAFGWVGGSFGRNVLSAFENYPWPGNIRELQNEVSRGLTLAGEGQTIELEHLSENLRRTEFEQIDDTASGDLKTAVSHYERAYIRRALETKGWNVTKTSDELGISRVGLQRKIKRLGIVRPR